MDESASPGMGPGWRILAFETDPRSLLPLLGEHEFKKAKTPHTISLAPITTLLSRLLWADRGVWTNRKRPWPIPMVTELYIRSRIRPCAAGSLTSTA